MKAILVCSSVDADFYKKYIPDTSVEVIPNGINPDLYKTPYQEERKKIIILFMGLLSYFPNDEGLSYYLHKIHPSIKSKLPNMEFHIIGKNAPLWLQEAKTRDRSIRLIGFVPDPKPYIGAASICIAPLLSGSGTRLKILEYMAMKKAVISTRKGAEGIDIEDKKHILFADNENEFIRAILLLAKDKKLRQSLGENARELVNAQYNWEKIGKKVADFYKQICI